MSVSEAKPTILIVDDSFINRMLLMKIFSKEYRVVEAKNGVEALALLRELPDVAAVILDIQMPELDGYGVMRAMQEDERLRAIPVVVDTISDEVESQLEALDCGAMDVLIKPINPQIALHRLRNILTRREADRQAARNDTLEQLLRQSELDEKTGMLNKHAFCRAAAELLRENPDREYAIVRWDVDRFKVFNDVFGVAAGDAFLAKVGAASRSAQNSSIVYGHWEADHFVICIPREIFEKHHFTEIIERLAVEAHDDFEFVARLGVYVVDDPELDVALMCDRALLALRSIKNSYQQRVAYYDESMRAALLEEQEIVGEMDRALTEHQFVVYYQPQYNYAAGALHGAEALVRWQHPEKGLIPPIKFIPVFERNGFVSRVDEYVWEQVCIQQRAWLDAGKPVVPVSVNISRRDIYNPHLCELISSLVNKYDLPPRLLRLEITESAYMDNAEQLLRSVEKLRAAGFAVEMDDFGSGYSSLNTLKEVPVDMLKLDMKFLEDSTADTKGGSILTSVVRMSHWIDLPVIAEGVETRAQAEYLKSIGCMYMQGYFFAKPMPASEFEKLLESGMEDASQRRIMTDLGGASDFLSASTQTTLLFNSFVGGASIIEYDGMNVEALRLNDKYFEVLGVSRESYDGRHLLDHFEEPYRSAYLSAIVQAVETGEETSCELCSLPLGENGGEIWTRTRMRLLAASENRAILYCSVENITNRMKLAEQLTAIMGSVPGGILDFEVSDQVRTVYFNDITATMFGYSREEYGALFCEEPLDVAHPEDRFAMAQAIENALHSKEYTVETVYRHRCADGGWRWARLTAHVTKRKGDKVFASGILMDIEDEMQAKSVAAAQASELERQRASLQTLYDTIPCGILEVALSPDGGKTAKLTSFNDAAWRICGYESRAQYVESFHGLSKLKDVHPDDMPRVMECVKALRASNAGERQECDLRVLQPNGSVRWVRALVQLRFDGDTKVVQVVFTDITEHKQENLRRMSSALFGLYNEVFEFDIEHDTCFMRSSKAPNDPRIGMLVPFSKHLKTLCERYALPEERERIRAFYASAGQRRDGEPETLEYRYQSGDSGVRWASATVLHLSGSSYLTCNRDITDQKEMKRLGRENEALQALVSEQHSESERDRVIVKANKAADEPPASPMLSQAVTRDRYRIVVEQTGTAVIDMDYETGLFSCSEAYGRYENSTRNQQELLSGHGDHSLVHPDDAQALDDFFAQRDAGVEHNEALLRMKMKDGSFRWTRMAGTYIRDEDGKLRRTIGTFTDVDEEMRTKLALQKITERTRRIVDNIPTGVIILEAGERFVPLYVSNRACELLGYTREENELRIANGEPLEFLPDAGALPPGGMERLKNGQPLVLHRLRLKRGDGSSLWVRVFMSMSAEQDGAPVCYAVLADISDEVAMEQKSLWQTEKYKILSESADLITFDYSPQDDVMRLSVPAPGEGLAEKVWEHYLETFATRGRMSESGRERFAAQLRAATRAAMRGTLDFEGDYYDTGMKWYRAKYVSLADAEGRVYRVLGRLDDISDIKREQDRLRVDAQLDSVTGVYNKRYAENAIGRALREKEPDGFDAVLFLDVDNFKALNDTYGHLEADEVLRQMGAILRKLFRKQDIIARFGGDEFVVYMREAGDIGVVMNKAAEVIRAVNAIVVGNGKPVCVSIGLTSVIGENASYEGALKRADTALYDAKENGKNQFAVLERKKRGKGEKGAPS